MAFSLLGMLDITWLLSGVLLWAVGVVLVSAWLVRLRFPARRPGPARSTSPVPRVLVLTAGIGSLLAVKWYLGLAGLAVGILCLAIVHVATLVAGTFSVMRDYRATLAVYDKLLQRGLRQSEARCEVSRLRHPELSATTHAEVADKCSDVNLLFFFYDTCAELGRRSLSDAHTLACLDSSTAVHRGPAADSYYFEMDRTVYYRALARHQTSSEPSPTGGEHV